MLKRRAAGFMLAICLGAVSISGCFGGETVPSSPDSTPTSGSLLESGYPLPDAEESLDEAKEKNSDTVAWLTVPGTTINEQVYQTGDNEFYLRRGPDKKYAFEGSLFLDFRNDVENLSQNNLIYGHNLGTPPGVKDDPNGVKFAQLLKFLDPEVAKNNPYLYLTSGEKQYVFRIFAVFYSEAYMKPVEYHHDSYTEEEMETLLADIQERSEYRYDVDVSPEDKFLTLSTCTYRFGTYTQNDDQRFVVMGRLVREGEAFEPTAPVAVNEAPKKPKF